MQVTFVASIQGHQTERVREIAERLRKSHAGLTVEVLAGDAAKATLARHKLNFGPAVVIDGRLEYVGVPRWSFLQERIAQVGANLPNPRSSVPPTPPAPAAGSPSAKPATPAKPAATPAATASNPDEPADA